MSTDMASSTQEGSISVPTESRPNVLYIAGSGRSGSTLLERLLGSMPNLVNVGEVTDIFRRVHAGDELCGCGRVFSACPFWTAVGDYGWGGWSNAPLVEVSVLQQRVARQRHIPAHLKVLHRTDFARARREYQDAYRRLYNAIQTVSGADFVVDASKQPAHLFALRGSGMDMRVLHLVRDVRGVSWSQGKRDVARPHSVRSRETMYRQAPLEAAGRWLACQTEIDLFGRLGERTATVRYEDLIPSPRPVIKSALQELGVEVEHGALDHVGDGVAHLPSSHGLSGNPSRFQQGEVPLRMDEAWRASMSRPQQVAVAAVASPYLLLSNLGRRRGTPVHLAPSQLSEPSAKSVGRLPNFLYIGPDKAGSTWLHEVLVKHPDIFLTPAKDLYFFDRYYQRGTEWYRRFFAGAGGERVVGEVCQDYLFDPTAPQRIQDVLGTPKMMVTLRDPAERAFSSYLYMRKHGRAPATFSEALDRIPKLIEHGRYGALLDNYREVFPDEAFHVAVFDDLKADPQRFLDAVLDWLEVDRMALSDGDEDSKLPASRARNVPLAWSARLAANVVRSLNGAELVGQVKRSRLVHRALYVPFGAEAPRMSPEDTARIHRELADDVTTLDRRYGFNLRERWGWTA
ncbi:sulfotransferase [uncultured Serinicoccus sp.]|uniref:sulfotransferase n=1 Tax=uncultured Serinicoccus sp. TaxID=735514 RepID=UPI00260BE588|nr:sulfotransferase [uncultured Serinicoccus sp.]